MIGIFLQARIGSKRLPRKELLPLGEKRGEREPASVLEHTMMALRRIPADHYMVLTDEMSAPHFADMAHRCGFRLFSGSPDNVLSRYCAAVSQTKVDIVVRATGDNPLVSADMAMAAIRSFRTSGSDFFALRGLPFGVGVEVAAGDALLYAAAHAPNQLEQEHVTPYIYSRPEQFRVHHRLAPHQFRLPTARVTLDTTTDYHYLQRLYRELYIQRPLDLPDIMEWLHHYPHPEQKEERPLIVLMPAVELSIGGGHRTRCQRLAARAAASEPHIDVTIDVPENMMRSELEQNIAYNRDSEVSSQRTAQIIAQRSEPLPARTLIVYDAPRAHRRKIAQLQSDGLVVGIDGGGPGRKWCDYLIDMLPRVTRREQSPNENELGYLPLKADPADPADLVNSADRSAASPNSDFEQREAHPQILLTFGNRDHQDLTTAMVRALLRTNAARPAQLTIVLGRFVPEVHRKEIERRFPSIPILHAPPDLRAHLPHYDLVITSFGITAYEAAAAGCGVLLLNSTRYHHRLAKRGNFIEIGVRRPRIARLKKIFTYDPRAPFAALKEHSRRHVPSLQKDILETCTALLEIPSKGCPVCYSRHNRIVARYPRRTYYSCRTCAVIYLLTAINEKLYDHDYFFIQYQRQYGRTYLEDWDAIYRLGLNRARRIMRLMPRAVFSSGAPLIFDIGCAYGAFLSAVDACSAIPIGLDVYKEGVEYVQTKLGFHAYHANFGLMNLNSLYAEIAASISSVQNTIEGFCNALTMWFVIEHFPVLDRILRRVYDLVYIGGIFAFSTPNGAGISALKSRYRFLQNSPHDHYTVWTPRSARTILRRYHFRVRTIVVTGHHPERFPLLGRVRILYPLLTLVSRLLRLGDTFEVYAEKISDTGKKSRRRKNIGRGRQAAPL